ncbi:MAG: molybdopterin-dependent oxidoreductase [Spirochaetes bacterium]|nr:molybdopterin-dependent oxidoreductase [Spirochaetota bacterium]
MDRQFDSVDHSFPKKDGEGLILGRPAYTDDLPPRDALWVKILRSPHAFARIVSVDASAALALPGVACVLTWKDVKRIPYTRAGQGYPEPSPQDKFVLDEYVRYVGDEVAVVAAEDEETALAALSLVKVEYAILEPVLDFETAADNATVIHPEPEIHDLFPIGFKPRRNIAASYEMKLGDVEKELAKSEIVLQKSFYTQAQAHVAMEQHASYSWLDVQGRLNICTSTQNPFHARRLVGQALDIPLRDIRVLKPRIGGGFGGKQHILLEPFVALVTLRTGRPARIALTRKEVFTSSFTRHQMCINIRMGADRDGRLNVIDMNVLSNTGAYGEHALTVFMVEGSKTLPLYNKVKAVHYGGKVVYTNKVSAGAFRGYGAIQGNFALESMLDEVAHATGLDPVLVRERNMIREGETSEVFRIMGEGSEGIAMVVESCKLDYCVARGKELIGWNPEHLSWEPEPGKVRALGMAIAMQGSGIPLVDMGSTSLELQDGGCFKMRMGATDLGTGSDTILAQIAAEELGVSVRDIIVYASDTDHTPFDVGAYASSTTFVSGNAALEAAKKMKQVLVEAVADRYELDPAGVAFDGVHFTGPDGSELVTLKQFSFDTLYHNGAKMKTLTATASYTGEKSPPPYMAGFAEIELDLGTGKVNVVRFVAVVDCGTRINPNLARIQVEGGLLQGIGMALYEKVAYGAKGKLLSDSLLSYSIPSREDVGNIEVEFAESYEPSGPFGAKSVAEIGIDTPPAAIANAIRNAAGIRLTETPFSPEAVLRALRRRA